MLLAPQHQALSAHEGHSANLLLSERFFILPFCFSVQVGERSCCCLHIRAHVVFPLISVSFQNSQTPFATGVLSMARFMKANVQWEWSRERRKRRWWHGLTPAWPSALLSAGLCSAARAYPPQCRIIHLCCRKTVYTGIYWRSEGRAASSVSFGEDKADVQINWYWNSATSRVWSFIRA